MNYLEIKIDGGSPSKVGGLCFRVAGDEIVTFAHYADGLKISERQFAMPDLDRIGLTTVPPVEALDE